MFSGQFAKIATLRYTLIMPSVLGIIYIGAFEGSRNWGDLWTLLFFGVLGWTMKQLKWPRPPLILGFVLGDIIERYMFISIQRYGYDWLFHPIVVVLFAMSALGSDPSVPAGRQDPWRHEEDVHRFQQHAEAVIEAIVLRLHVRRHRLHVVRST